MGEVVRLTLEGPAAKPGRVPASDVGRLLRAYERAVARAAEVRVNREARTGRRGASVEVTTRLIFRSARKGSLKLDLEFPELDVNDESLDIAFLHLGNDAARDVQRLLADPSDEAADQRVVEAVALLADDLDIGERYPGVSVEWVHTARNFEQPPKARLTPAKRQVLRERRLRAAAEEEIRAERRLLGTLVEADFEGRSARLRTTDNRSVEVTFGDAQADDIYEWLRRQTAVIGEVGYTSEGRIVDVRLVAIEPPEQLALFERSNLFHQRHSVLRLALEQQVEPIEDLSTLPHSDASAEEQDAFLAALSL